MRKVIVPAAAAVVGGALVFWLFGSNAKWDLPSIAPPWGGRPSIYEHIRSHLPDVGTGLREGGEELPDEQAVVAARKGMRWVAGGLDGAFGHHAGPSDDSKVARSLFAALKRALQAPTQRNIHAFYAEIGKAGALETVDPLLELINESDVPRDRLAGLSTWLAKESADREAVKLGIAMLGLFPGSDHHQLLKVLGRHEEFTLYASVALTNSDPEGSESHLFELAKHVKGWGRIQIVERLAQTQDPEIQRWMLRQGYKNSVMYEYLAYTCATAGGLREALEADAVDDELLAGAGDLISTLATGAGAAETIDDYADGVAVVRHYLRHVQPVASTLDQFLSIASINRFVTDTESDWTSREKNGWTHDVREDITARTSAILARPIWRQQVERGLEDDDDPQFWKVSEAAKVLAMDIWEVYFRRTLNGKEHWFELMQTRDRARIDRVVALAQETLPLAKMASGPSDELGLGEDFKDHNALDFIVQDLRHHPGVGWPLVKAALRSPTVRNRNMAAMALAKWGRNSWPADAIEALDAALKVEPNDGVRDRFQRLVDGRPLED